MGQKAVGGEMTPHLQHIYDVLSKWLATHSYSPTVRELTQLCGLSSYGSMHKDLLRLRKLGLVTWERRKQRTLRLS